MIPNSPIAENGLGTIDSFKTVNISNKDILFTHCKRGFIKPLFGSPYIKFRDPGSMTPLDIMAKLDQYPLAAAMAIPNCHSGVIGRGGQGMHWECR